MAAVAGVGELRAMHDMSLLLDVLQVWLALLSLLATLVWVLDPRDCDAHGPEAPVRTLASASGAVVNGAAAELEFAVERSVGAVVLVGEPAWHSGGTVDSLPERSGRWPRDDHPATVSWSLHRHPMHSRLSLRETDA
jgi:hypothetical protein